VVIRFKANPNSLSRGFKQGQFTCRRDAPQGNRFVLPTPNPMRVLIVDDYAVVREGLRVIVNAEPDMTIVAEGRTGRR